MISIALKKNIYMCVRDISYYIKKIIYIYNIKIIYIYNIKKNITN